jgi:malonyl-CoA/methylmalonyl-CoA synthetase
MTNHLFDALFARHATNSAIFLHLPDGQTVTYAEFFTQAARFANAIRASGLNPGDRLALQLDKSPDMLALIAGAIGAGVVFLPLNSAYTPAEVAYFLNDSGAKLLICEGRSAASLKGVAEASNAALSTLNSDGSGDFADFARQMPASFTPTDRGADDLAGLLYTSGTTGRSKGAMLSHDNLLSNARVLADSWRFTQSDVLLHALPVFHTHGLFVATNVALLAGCSMIFLPKFDVNEVIRQLPASTAMMGVPTFYTRLLEDPRLDHERVKDVRLFVSGSAPLLAETHKQWLARTGHRILERYGMTETNMNTSNPYDGERRAGTVGQPLPGVELRICDAEGREMSKGEIGMIEVRGPNVFQGYWNMPEKTLEELRPDGFFITGDLGQVDENGYVTIVGRGKDLIISGGFNIYPKEVELVLDGLPQVLESAVIGVPHPDFGEAVVAVVVPAVGAEADPQMITSSLGQQLARFKHPKHIAFRTALPRNTMGKVQKNVLRDELADLFAL